MAHNHVYAMNTKKSKTEVGWGSMIPDLLIMIASRLNSFHDFLAFQRVCKSWKKVATKESFSTRSYGQPPLLSLNNTTEDNNHMTRNFYCLTNEKIHRMILPELYRKRYVETLGWLVIEDMVTGYTELFHPFSKVRFLLPKLKLRYSAPVCIHKAVLSASPSYTQNFILVVIYDKLRELAYWRPGNTTWNCLEKNERDYIDILFYKNQLHTLNQSDNIIYVWNLDSDNAVKVKDCLVSVPSLYKSYSLCYLVESNDMLLLVSEIWNESQRKFKVYEVDICRSGFKLIKDLGNRALFVGRSASSSIDTCKFPTIKPNCVYYTRGDTCNKDAGRYNLISNEIESCCKDQILSRVFGLINWITPSF